MIIEWIQSPKHKGAVFLKERGGEFVCKVYPEGRQWAKVIQAALEKVEKEEGAHGDEP